MADPRIYNQQQALDALMRTRRTYATMFSRNGGLRQGTAAVPNPLLDGPHGPLSPRSVYKIRYVLQQALIKRFRTWKATMADRQIRNLPYDPAYNNRPRAELDARRELADARMAEPPKSHHKQPGGRTSFNAGFEQPVGPANAAPQRNGQVSRNHLMGRGQMSGGRQGHPSNAYLVRRLIGENSRFWHTSGMLPGSVVGAPNARPNPGPGGLYARRITPAYLAMRPYNQTAGQLDYMTRAHVNAIADFKRRQNAYRYSAGPGDQHEIPYHLGQGDTDNFDLDRYLHLPGGAINRPAARNAEGNMSGYRWLLSRFREPGLDLNGFPAVAPLPNFPGVPPRPGGGPVPPAGAPPPLPPAGAPPPQPPPPGRPRRARRAPQHDPAEGYGMPHKGSNYRRMMLKGDDSEETSSSESDSSSPKRQRREREDSPDAARAPYLDPKVENYALSEDDIRKLAGKVPIYRYPDLAGMSSPDDMFKGAKAAVLLFLTEGRDNGHWLTVLDHPDEIEVFDSFGVGTWGFVFCCYRWSNVF